jgi:hypothetical protein
VEHEQVYVAKREPDTRKEAITHQTPLNHTRAPAPAARAHAHRTQDHDKTDMG